nr:hypothetical protein [Tanacetum cinerariifolium]
MLRRNQAELNLYYRRGHFYQSQAAYVNLPQHLAPSMRPRILIYLSLTKKGKNMTDSQSPEEGVGRIRNKSPRKHNFGVNHEGKYKSKNGKRSEQAEQVLFGTVIRMIRGYTSRKRPHEQAEQWLDNEISFPFTPGCQLIDSPIILEALIEEFLVRRIYVDGGSSSKVMLQTIPMKFAVVKSHSPYNVILGQTGLRSLGVVASTIHSMIKFSTTNGIAIVTTKKETLHECWRMKEAQGPTREEGVIFLTPDSEGTVSMGRKENQRQTNKKGDPEGTTQLPPSPPRKDTKTYEKIKENDGHPKGPLENKPLEKVVIHDDYPDQTITIGGNLSAEYRSKIIKILHKHADAFAWTPTDMTGILRSIAKHELKTYPNIEPRVQRKQSIAMTEERATYQRLVDTIFEGQMVSNLEAYVNDMVIKSKTEPKMIKDIKETLFTLKKVNMKLDPKKCSFRIEEGKFLGYIVTFEGIRANPKKEKPIVNMPSPTNLKQMQRLSGKLDSLNRFLSKAAKKALPCLDTLKRCTNKKDFHWKTEAEEAFQEMKKLIAKLPTLTTPNKEKELMVYLSAASEVVKAVLLVERQRKQASIHYVSRTLRRWKSCPTQIKASGPNDTLAEGKRVEKQEAPEDKAPKNLGIEADLWKLHTDGASNERGSRAGLILIDLEGAEYSYALRLNFVNSNNDAEYEALLAGLQQAKYLIKEIYMGSCGMHDGPRKAVHKAMNAGYFWPSMHRDANNEVSSCDSCQVCASVPKLPKIDMIFVTSVWPFRKWEIDIVWPLPEAPGKVKYLIVDVDYSTKWIEAMAVTSITGRQVKTSHLITSYAEGLGIKLVFTLVYHPQANGVVERANRSIMQGIKTRLHHEGGAWVEELPNAFWAHRTTPKTSNEETPFSLTYGTEAVIPAKIGIPTRRTIRRSDEENEDALRMNFRRTKRDRNN